MYVSWKCGKKNDHIEDEMAKIFVLENKQINFQLIHDDICENSQ